MKHTFYAMLLLGTLGMPASAQENNSLFKNGKPNLSYSSIELQASGQYGQLDQSKAFYGLGKIGIGLNHKWSVGLWGNMSLNNVRPASEQTSSTYLDYRAAGLYTRFSPWSERSFHISFPLSVGGGEVELDAEENEIDAGEAYFMLMEPGILLETNLWPQLAFHIGATYRLTSDLKYRSLPANSLNALQAQIGFRWRVDKKD